MKVKTSFTTNSSSSSFIIAKHKDCTREEIVRLLGSQIDDYIKTDAEYCYDFEELLENNSKKKARELFKNQVIDSISDMYPDLELDNWEISAIEGNSEGGSLSSFLYARGCVDGDKLKIRDGG